MKGDSSRDVDTEAADIQCVILWGYGALSNALFFLLTIGDEPEKVRAWMRTIIPEANEDREDKVRHADRRRSPRRPSFNIAFTARGLRRLGVADKDLRLFSQEFLEGMASKRRERVLGDVKTSHRQHWIWADRDLDVDSECQPVDIAFMLYGPGSTLPTPGGELGDVPAAEESDAPAGDALAAALEDAPAAALGDTPPAAPGDVSDAIPGDGAAAVPDGTAEASPDDDVQDKASKEFDELCEHWRGEFAKNGLHVAVELPTHALLPDHGRPAREHFGFADGLAQPGIRDWRRSGGPGTAANEVGAGEFLLGFEDEEGPGMPRTNNQVLWNGSYMVFRQLAQDAKSFWDFVRGYPTANASLAKKLRERVWAGSKIVGRWPNGAPMVLAEDWEEAREYDRASRTEMDAFLYHAEDRSGHKCPFGAHVRRANPRDSVLGPDPDENLRIVKRRRIIRRGRSYGDPVIPGMLRFEEVMALDDDEYCEHTKGQGPEGRGLYFICFNAEIRRQFEFIQQSWINSPIFGGLENDPDPIAGTANEGLHHPRRVCFTIPDRPARKRLYDFKRYVTVKGGGYFFMPGINALRILAKEPTGDSDAS